MDFLSQPYDLYQGATKGLESAWVVVKPDPGGKNNYLLAQDGDPNELWHMVDQTIRNAANRYNKFSICVAPNKNAMQTVIPVTVVANPYNQQGGQMAGIGSLPGMYGGFPTPESIGAIEKRLEEKYEEKLKATLKEKEYEDRLAGLEEMLKTKRKKGDVMEQIGEFCKEQEIDLNPLVEKIPGIIMGIFSRKPMAMPGLAGVRGRNGADVHRAAGSQPVPHDDDDLAPGTELETEDCLEDANTVALNEAVYKELMYAGGYDPSALTLEYAKLIFATIELHQFIGGLKQMGLANADMDAVNILAETADFIIKNPKKAQELVQEMKGDTNKTGA